VSLKLHKQWQLLFGLLLLVRAASASEWVGVNDPQRAEYNWVMHCRGCHGIDAKGSKGGAPNMVGVVSQFLHTEEGRAYLGRVPGVAFVALPNSEVADLLNWLTQTFDRGHMPKGFVPYKSEEVAQLKKSPLITEAFNKRQEILESLAGGNVTVK